MSIYVLTDSISGRNSVTYMLPNRTNNMGLMSGSAGGESGTYKKPTSVYYVAGSPVQRPSDKENIQEYERQLLAVEKSASHLRSSVIALRKNGDVSGFVESYDELLEATKTVSQGTMKGAVEKLLASTKVNYHNLEKLGIEIKEDGMLQWSEDTLTPISDSVMEELFDGTDSYGYQMEFLSTTVGYNARQELSRSTAHTYSEAGGYGSNHSYNHSYVTYA